VAVKLFLLVPGVSERQTRSQPRLASRADLLCTDRRTSRLRLLPSNRREERDRPICRWSVEKI